FESGVPSTVDPVGGAGAIEEMTDRIEREARTEIEAIDAMGGAVRGIEQGYQARRIEASAYQYQLEIERQERIIVGVNRFGDPEAMGRPTFLLDPALEAAQSARRDGNLVPAVVDAVKASATLGEISDALRRVYHSYDPGA